MGKQPAARNEEARPHGEHGTLQCGLTPGKLLKTLLPCIADAPGMLAGYYLNCHVSLVYKWMRDEVLLPRKHVPTIVNFVLAQADAPTQTQLRSRIEGILLTSPLCDDAKKSIAAAGDFGLFLSQAFEQAITLRRAEQLDTRAREKRSLPEPRRQTQIRPVVCCFFACVTGGVLWSVINRLFGLHHYLGGSGSEPAGILSFLWGVLATAPVIIFARLSVMAGNAGDKQAAYKNAGLTLLYSLLGGLGAFIFYNSGFRAFIENFHLSYGLQELLIAFVHAVLLSGPPLLALMILRRQAPLWFLPAGAFLCAAAASLTALGTWLVKRPEPEVSQLRGLAVALALRLCMFIATYFILKPPVLRRPRIPLHKGKK